MEGIFIKVFSYLLTVLGGLSTVFGLFPVIFLYPYKFSQTSDYLTFIFFETEDRWFWQIGVIVLVIGIILLYKNKRKNTLSDCFKVTGARVKQGVCTKAPCSYCINVTGKGLNLAKLV
ncbi:hypothetical protein [Virgibacillus sp. JSM 102003]|uniref:hypothetical protein n=1 Tax=Virgibacillus sp. JSM 102003 TaxID=1562108 RepID=UPI0035BF2EB2